jgi:uncharacterized protein YecE (DUF72 family)
LDPALSSTGILVGTSGWAYPSWKPDFYPPKVPAKRFLEYYSSRLNSVEVNYTFRALPTASMLAGWLEMTGPEFRFSFKAPQRITHFSRLVDASESVERFLSALDPIRQAGRLGVLLFQLPPNFKADPALLLAFLQIPALSGPSQPQIAFEFRHQSWFADPVYDVLRSHNAAMCIAESDELITPEVHCARTHTAFRLRRSGGYEPQEIEQLTEKFVALAADRKIYIYLKHEDEPSGALNAAQLLDACAQRAGKQ